MEEENSRLKKENETNKARASYFSTQLEKKTKENDELTSRLQESEGRMDELRRQYNESINQIHEIQKDYLRLNSALENHRREQGRESSGFKRRESDYDLNGYYSTPIVSKRKRMLL